MQAAKRPLTFTRAGAAIDTARQWAAKQGVPWTVWRAGDVFWIRPESAGWGWDDPPSLPRPVATYDPDGTEHA